MVDLAGRGDERRDQPHDLAPGPGREHDQVALQRRPYDALREFRVGDAAVALVRAHELEPDHQPEPAQVPQAVEPPPDPGERREKLCPAITRVLHEPLVLDHVEGRVRGGAGHRVAAVRAAVCPGRPPGQQIAPGHDPAQREPRRDPLGHHQDVRHHAGVGYGEQLAGAPEAGLHLVGHEQDPVPGRDLPQSGQERGRRHPVAALAENGLDHERGHPGGHHHLREQLLELGLPVAGAGAGVVRSPGGAVAVGVGRVVHGAGEGLEVAADRHTRGGEGHGLRRPAVEAATEGDDGGAPGGRPGELDGRLRRLGPGVGQEGLPVVAGQHVAQPLVQPQPGLVVDDVLLAVQQPRRLRLDRGDDPRVGVAGVRDADPRAVVQVPLTLHRDQPGTFAPVDHEVGVARPDGGDDRPVRHDGGGGVRLDHGSLLRRSAAC